MKFGRFVFVVFGAALILSACGGNNPPNTAPAPTPQRPGTTVPTGGAPRPNGYPNTQGYNQQQWGQNTFSCSPDGSVCYLDVYVDGGGCASGCDTSNLYYSPNSGQWAAR